MSRDVSNNQDFAVIRRKIPVVKDESAPILKKIAETQTVSALESGLNKEFSVLIYKDYRLWLEAIYRFRKKTRKNYSFSRLACDLGFRPGNFLHLVLRKKRNLSFESIERIKQCMEWTGREKRYFHTLVLCNQENNPAEKEKLSLELDKILEDKETLIDDEHNKCPLPDRDVCRMTMRLTPEQFERFRQKISSLRDEMRQEIREPQQSPTLTARLNIQFFRMAP